MEDKDYKKYLSINTVMSIPLLSINFYESLFFTIYVFIEIGLLIYKNQKYPFPTYALNIEGTILAMFILTQVARYMIIQKGILDKQPSKIILYVILTIFVIPSYVFFLRLQTYVLLVEVFINWIGIAFNIMQVLLSIWVWKVFQRKKSLS